MQTTAHQTYCFDEFKLDLTRGCLFRATVEVKLRPQSFEVLKFLTQNQGRLVSKDELIASVWNGMAVTDDSLVQCLKDIRRALGDDEQRIIKTVPRRGYIFDAPVSDNRLDVYTEETSSVHLVMEEVSELPSRPDRNDKRTIRGLVKRHKLAAFATSATLITLVGAGVVFYRPIVAWWLKPPSIAVLPMVNATGDAGLDYISDGLTETIITSLVQINSPGTLPRLRVTAHNTVLIFKGKEIEPRNVGQQLGVDVILASKMVQEDRLRTFKFELINVADGSIVWNKQYGVRIRAVQSEPGLTDDFLVKQNDIFRDVAAQLPLNFSDADLQNLTRRYTQNAEAYDEYLKGRAEFRRSTKPSSLRRSIEYYQQALDLDPKFALAFSAMGLSYAAQGLIGERPQRESNEKAFDLFRTALDIDSTLAIANNAMKMRELNAWDWKAIEEAGPRHPGYSSWNGGFLIAMGRLDEQLEFERRLLSIDPFSPQLNFSHATTLFLARRYDEAIGQYHKTLNIRGDGIEYFGPESPWIRVGLGNTYASKGMFTEAIAEMKLAKDLAEGAEGMWASLGYAYAKAGQRDEATNILNRLTMLESEGEYVPPLNVAAIFIALGDHARAFVYLEKAFDDRMDRLRMIKTHPFYDPIRHDPRFVDLIRRMGLPP